MRRHRRVWIGWGAIAVAALLLLGAAPANAADSDGDGIANANDRCPSQRGPRPSGCPVGQWRLRNPNSAGPANSRFSFGISAWTPVTGDWDGDGDDSVGAYDPRDGKWRLAEVDEEAGTGAEVITLENCLVTGIVAPKPHLPITGDWDGDGVHTIGIYTPATGQFHLRNSNTTGPADIVFAFGGVQPSAQIRALAGDFDGDGVHTVALYRRDTNRWRLRNTNSAGPADIQFVFGPPDGSQSPGPIVGDWDDNGTETVGVGYIDFTWDELLWRLRNTNAPGQADLSYAWGAYDIATSVVAGDWNGDGRDSTGFRSP